MNNKLTWICWTVVAVTALTASSFAAKKLSPEQSLDKFMCDLEGGLIFPSQVKELQKYSKARDEAVRIRATALFAQYADEVEEQPLIALKMVAQYILEPEQLKQWLSDVSKARVKKPKKGESPKLPAEFPGVSEWNMKYPELCVQAGRILTSFGKHQAAVAVFDKVGRNLQGTPQVLAAEGGGDLLVNIQRYAQAIEWYDFALGAISHINSRDSYDQKELDRVLQLIGQRIGRKRANAQRLLDIEMYGEGFVMYREARTYELTNKDYLMAAVSYQDIIDTVPDTVYSEAAALYKGKCLFELSDPEQAKKAKKHIQEEEKDLKVLNTRLRKYGKKFSRRVRKDLLSEIEDKSWLLMALKNVPLGEKAPKVAQAELQAFIEKNEYGLYRGEAMILLADYYLETQLESDKAREWYEEAMAWLKSVREVDAELDGFEVPGKAMSVSAPPATEKTTAGWNNYIVKEEMMPSQIINRITCQWYLDSLSAACGGKLSLCCFLKGDIDGAVQWAESILKYDRVEGSLFRDRGPNSYSRLLRGYRRGWLCCSPKELALFKGKQKVAVVLGGFYYQVEEEERCFAIRNKLVEGKCGELNKDQESNAKYRLASILFRQMKIAEARSILAEFIPGKYKNTYSEAMALIGLGNIAMQTNSSESYKEAIRHYEKAVTAARDKGQQERALYYLARAHEVNGESKEAVRVYRTLLQKHPDTVFHKLTVEHMSGILDNG